MTKAHQVGVSFTDHHRLVYEYEGPRPSDRRRRQYACHHLGMRLLVSYCGLPASAVRVPRGRLDHRTGPVIVSITADGDAATAHTQVRGYHHIADAGGGPVWQVAGHYVLELVKQADRWKITSLTLETFYQEGNLALPVLASERTTSTPRQGSPQPTADLPPVIATLRTLTPGQ